MGKRSWLAACCLLLTGCGSGVIGGTVPAPEPVPASPTATISHGNRNGPVATPPPFLVRYGETQLELAPFTYCYRSGCVDGFDDAPVSIGSPEEIFVLVQVEDFDELVVTQAAGDDVCARTIPAEVESLGGGWWRVRPRGPAADYRLSIFASGDGAGDMVADLRWRNPSDQPMPEPDAGLTLIVDHDGRPDSYGLELYLTGLETTPDRASARITVTAANGRSLTFDATRATAGCEADGTVRWDGPADQAKRAAGLGDFPFTMRVEVVLDGVTHVATATYPDDQIKETESSLPLRFEPPLN